VLTGHGCFGEYLCRIGREGTTACHHCMADRETAQHTLAECQAWSVLRCDLEQQVGNDLSLPVLITKIVSSERLWKAVASFCEQVMLQKEVAERIRRHEAAAAASSEESNEEQEEEDTSEADARSAASTLLFV